MIAFIIIATIAMGGLGLWTLYKPPGPGPPLNIGSTDNQPTQNETGTSPELTNITSPETDETPEITNTTDTSPETPEFNETTTIIEVTVGELLWNAEISLRYPPDDEVKKAKEWLGNISSAEFIRVTGVLIKQEIEEREDVRGNKYWAIYLGDFEETGRVTKVRIVFRNTAEIQKFKDLNLNKGDKLQFEGDRWGFTSEGGCWLDNCKIIQKITNP